MSTNVEPFEVEAPPAHPSIPVGVGSSTALTGIVAAAAAAVSSVVENGLGDKATISYIISALALVAVFFAGRSMQAKAAIEKTFELRAQVARAGSAVNDGFILFEDEYRKAFDFETEMPVEQAPAIADGPDVGDVDSNVGPDGKPLV